MTVTCEICGTQVDPQEANYERNSNLIICKPCQPDYRSLMETDGHQVDFIEVHFDDYQELTPI